MTMLVRPCRGRLPVPRATVLCVALILATPVIASIAHAEEESEPQRARIEMDGTLARMMSASRQVRDLLRDARRRGARPEVACLDETLSRADVARRSARAQAAEALAAYGRSDFASARAARSRVADLDVTQRIALRDAGSCLPRPVVEQLPPGTTVRMTIDPSLPRVSFEPR